jgi:hypothetical protein
MNGSASVDISGGAVIVEITEHVVEDKLLESEDEDVPLD